MNHARQNRRRKAKACKKLARWRARRTWWQTVGYDYRTLEFRLLSQLLIDIDPTARIVDQIHDEIIVECAKSRSDALARVFFEHYTAAGATDPHRVAAMHLFGVPYSEVTGAMRETAKRVEFSKNYGISPLEIGRLVHDTLEDQLS